jgi:hypothetical protein
MDGKLFRIIADNYSTNTPPCKPTEIAVVILMDKVQYIVEQNSEGQIEFLYRFGEDDEGLVAEYLEDRVWIHDNRLIEILYDLHSVQYNELTESEAARIAPLFGGVV